MPPCEGKLSSWRLPDLNLPVTVAVTVIIFRLRKATNFICGVTRDVGALQDTLGRPGETEATATNLHQACLLL